MLNEVGDPAVMQEVLNETGSPNSIGRAQQILILKQKVKELEAKQHGSYDKIESSSRGNRNFYMCTQLTIPIILNREEMETS